MKWTEWYVQQYFAANNKTIDFITTLDPDDSKPREVCFFRDTGKFTVRSNPDGSRWKQRTDTKQLWMLSPPTERFSWPRFTKKDWREVLETQMWPDGKVPFLQKQDSFKISDDYWEGGANWTQASYEEWQRGEEGERPTATNTARYNPKLRKP